MRNKLFPWNTTWKSNSMALWLVRHNFVLAPSHLVVYNIGGAEPTHKPRQRFSLAWTQLCYLCWCLFRHFLRLCPPWHFLRLYYLCWCTCLNLLLPSFSSCMQFHYSKSYSRQCLLSLLAAIGISTIAFGQIQSVGTVAFITSIDHCVFLSTPEAWDQKALASKASCPAT